MSFFLMTISATCSQESNNNKKPTISALSDEMWFFDEISSFDETSSFDEISSFDEMRYHYIGRDLYF